MDTFPRTMVGGVSMPRMIIGTNWFEGYSHTSAAKDRFIKSYQSADQVADILCVFLEYGIDAIMGMAVKLTEEACKIAEDRTGKRMIRIWTPSFNLLPGGNPEQEPERTQISKCTSTLSISSTITFTYETTTYGNKK